MWMLYHLAEYFGTVALWSWLGDLAPQRIRGRFLGRRERWLTLGRIAGVLVTGFFTLYWREYVIEQPLWIAYGLCAAAGGAMMLVSMIPLASMPSIPLSTTTGKAPSWPTLLAPLRDRRFLRLVTFGCWFSLMNGLTQAAQNISHYNLFHFHLFAILAFQAAMRLGQGGLSPWIGRLVDRLGNRPVLVVSQVLVATGPLFYFFAATQRVPGDPRWVAVAWLAWIAYAGLNVGLPNLMLKLSPGGNSTSYIAAYFGVTGAIYGVGTVAGGLLFDRLTRTLPWDESSSLHLDQFQLLFLVGFVGRLLGVPLLLRLVEPGARRLWTRHGS
jgi:MFS family permease